MERIIKVVCFLILAMLPGTVDAQVNTNDGFNWNPIIDAIIQVESEGKSRAVSGNSCGVMQITPVLVKDCNRILAKRRSKKRFKLSDRFSVKKSKEMFLLFQSFYNPMNSIEQAIRSWNGGVRYSIEKTQCYFDKVMKFIE
jgi:hypothetical protein